VPGFYLLSITIEFSFVIFVLGLMNLKLVHYLYFNVFTYKVIELLHSVYFPKNYQYWFSSLSGF
jgi:hypothetical protein